MFYKWGKNKLLFNRSIRQIVSEKARKLVRPKTKNIEKYQKSFKLRNLKYNLKVWVNIILRSFNSKRNWFFATNSDFKIPEFLHPNVADLRYFKLWILLDQIIKRFTPSGCKGIGIRKLEFVVKTQFLCRK